MSPLNFQSCAARARVGLKGPRAAEWLANHGIVAPPRPNSWAEQGSRAAVEGPLLVARLGSSEFFLEAGGVIDPAAGAGMAAPPAAVGRASGPAVAGGAVADAAVAVPDVRQLAAALQPPPAGVYPVLREDAAFVLSGEGTADVLAQVCNVHFAALDLQAQPLIMTLLIGVAVLIVPQPAKSDVRYRIWCDPTFGPYLEESVARVVIECGGSHGGTSI